MTIIRALLAFWFLPNKDTQTYVQVFQYLMNECRKYETNLFSINVYVDLEVPIHKGRNIVLPRSNVNSCRFLIRTIMICIIVQLFNQMMFEYILIRFFSIIK